MLQSIQGAVLALPGVIDCYCDDNSTASSVTVQGVTIPQNAIYIAVAGGTSTQIAQTIWTKKMPGCPYYTGSGSTFVTVQQTVGYNPPYPTYSVSYVVPADLQILFSVNLVNSSAVPSNAQTLISNAILAAFEGEDGGSRAGRIAAELLASRFYASICSPMMGGQVNPYYCPWAKIISIQIGSSNSPGASFTGSVSGTTLTVSSVASGTIAVGQTLFDTSGSLIPGTTITAGSGTSWTVSNSQTVGSEAMTGVTAGLFTITPQLNQISTTSAPLVSVTLT
jgi:hypothetical protein